MVTTPSMVEFLQTKSFDNLAPWARGVDLTQFNPKARFVKTDDYGEDVYAGLERPIFVNVGGWPLKKILKRS